MQNASYVFYADCCFRGTLAFVPRWVSYSVIYIHYFRLVCVCVCPHCRLQNCSIVMVTDPTAGCAFVLVDSGGCNYANLVARMEAAHPVRCLGGATGRYCWLQ